MFWPLQISFFRSLLFSRKWRILPNDWIFLWIRPERHGCPWSGVSSAAECVVRNSLVVILFCLLHEVGPLIRKRVTSVCAFVGHDLLLVSASPVFWALKLGRIVTSVLLVGKFIGSRMEDPSCGFDTHPAGAKSLSKTFDCFPAKISHTMSQSC